MEISKDDVVDTEVDANIESDVCSESREYEGLDNYGPDLE